MTLLAVLSQAASIALMWRIWKTHRHPRAEHHHEAARTGPTMTPTTGA